MLATRRPLQRCIYFGVPIFLSLVLLSAFLHNKSTRRANKDAQQPPPPVVEEPILEDYEPILHPNGSARVLTPVDELFQRQSTTLAQASARYTLHTGRAPPPGYDKWFEFAREGKCLIDEYQQVYDDFEPFYQLARLDPGYFARMLKRGMKVARGEYLGLRTYENRGHKFDITDTWPEDVGYGRDWMATGRSLSHLLPDMDLLFSMRDECRIQVDPHDGRSVKSMLGMHDPTPFTNRPHPTFMYYTEEGHCLYPNDELGFLDFANNVTAFFLYSTSQEFSTDLYPLLSQGKIHPCFSDILFPSSYYYDRSPSSPKNAFEDNVPWDEKKPLLYWRGRVAGGMVHGENYRSFPRFRLIDIMRANPGMMDFALMGWNTWCDGDCDMGAIEREYDFATATAPREEVYQYKYAMDVDGHGWSGRFLGLLRSGSLVFKSTIFTEFFSQWIRPFEHYIPVRPDLADLVERLEWAHTHEEEAKKIQEAGKEFAERIITDAQNDCYFFLVLLEWARLQEGAAGSWWWPWRE
ncbi:CAP10 domain-containing protein [Mycena chlorophos]|uniref:CAP10 domain-containing protein n=1 Tax=Mycena chlorophos TaxID=658473 RepID=A0A8H6W775_MYCCL|nr:CAP10 domain-containing protein [Mycena chlorophos]